MNKQMKQHLEAVVDALVEQDSAAAKEAFHEYLRLKSQTILMGESVESEEDKDDEDKDDKDKDDKDEDDKKDKDEKKAPPFEKKDDKDDKKKKEEDCEM